jgi:hypothetical protein
MDKEKELEIIEQTQAMVAQMREDDIEENPDSEYELFTCSACGEDKPKAGSVVYSDYILCNDCVLYAEVGFALGKIESVSEVVDLMEDKRLQDLCQFILEDQIRQNN